MSRSTPSSSPSLGEDAALLLAASQASRLIGAPGGLSVLHRGRSASPEQVHEEQPGARSPNDDLPPGAAVEPVEHENQQHRHPPPHDDEDDAGLCIICLTECLPAAPIWSCDVCFISLHLDCMRGWLDESQCHGRSGRCPGCQQHTGPAYELVYNCWCRKVCWDLSPEGIEGLRPSHSCGQVCGRERPNGCVHRCAKICHRGRCEPCGETRQNVPCLGGHQIFPPFPCGQEVPVCTEKCNARLECGHSCTATCHAGSHAECTVPVKKTCACGSSVLGVTVPCSQQVVQCDTLCQKLRSCGQHRCERKCHLGECSEKLVASAWNKSSWVRVGGATPVTPAASSVTVGRAPSWGIALAAKSPQSLSAAGADEFPVLGASTASQTASRCTTPSIPKTPGSFESCGKICGRMRACGHACTAICHAQPSSSTANLASHLRAAAGDESKESKENDEDESNLRPPPLLGSAPPAALSKTAAAPSTIVPAAAIALCEGTTRCTQLVSLSCPCGRKVGKIPCCEATVSQSSSPSKWSCDQTCSVLQDGRRFFDLIERIPDQELEGAKILLPFTKQMLSSLANAESAEGKFIRKLEQSIQKFIFSLAEADSCASNSSSGSATKAPASSPTGSSAGKFLKTTSGISTASAPSPSSASSHLFLTGLTPARRAIVNQFALWTNLHFSVEGGYLERLHPSSAGVNALIAEKFSRQTSGRGSPVLSRRKLEERKEQEEDAASDLRPSLHPTPSPTGSPCSTSSSSLLGTFPLSLSSPSAPMLPSVSPSSVAERVSEVSLDSVVRTADTWPGCLRLRVIFPTESSGPGPSDSELEADRIMMLRKWFALWRLDTRLVFLSSKLVVVLFPSTELAHEVFVHVRSTYESELSQHGVVLEAPLPSPAAQAIIDQEESEQLELKRQSSEQRRQTEETYNELKLKQAKQRQVAVSESVITPAFTSSTLSLFRSELTGHSKLRVSSKNVFALLDEDDE